MAMQPDIMGARQVQIVLHYSERLKRRLLASQAESAQRQRDADEERARLRLQAEASDEVQRRLAVAEERIAELQSEQRDMLFKYRRCAGGCILRRNKENGLRLCSRLAARHALRIGWLSRATCSSHWMVETTQARGN